MKSHILGLRVASVLFVLMAVGKLTPFLILPEIVVEVYVLPL